MTAERQQSKRAARPVRDALRAGARARNMPLSASLELTKRCNLRCYHCYIAGEQVELETQAWLDALEQLEAMGCMHILLTGGEATLRHDFFVIAARVKALRMTLTVLTNGTLLDDEGAARLAELRPFKVAVSMYGASAEKHDAVTGIKGSFARSIAALRALHRHGVRCRLSCTLMPETIGEVSAIIELAEELGCDYLFDPTVSPRSDDSDDVLRFRLPAERLREFYTHKAIVKRYDWQAKVSDATVTHLAPGQCGAGFTSLHIDANGDVLPCVGFGPAFGNLDDESLASLWRGSLAEDHRRRMREPLVECTGCKYVRSCAVRCPRLAVFESGSVSGKSPRACEIAAVSYEMAQVLAADVRD